MPKWAWSASRVVADFFESTAREHGDPKTAANWVMGEVLAALNATGLTLDRFPVRPVDLAQLLNMVRDGVVSRSAARQVFTRMVETGDRPERIAERDGLLKVEDVDALSGWIDQAIAQHPAEWERFRAGERKLLGVLVGAVMKLSRGSADPKRVNQLLLERTGT